MRISYNWLCDYLPTEKNGTPVLDPEKLSRILTSIGLEVESMEKYEEVKGGLKGLVVGEVLATEKHPQADRLTVTRVNIGSAEPLQIVCGAPNVATGQKVVVAKVGTTIHPASGEPVTMKLAKIRGVESQGMICAEDEIGMGNSHDGILVLDPAAKPGMALRDLFDVYEDHVFELGITPNRMDAMSHWGVARDVCAYLSHHEKREYKPRFPTANGFKPGKKNSPVSVKINNPNACQRYSGLYISGVTIQPSPTWLQQKLKAIGVRPINNLVDITNFILHETGQPLHAFDADKLSGDVITIRNLPGGTNFTTLDEKNRELHEEDLMICDASGGICIAGVYGGLNSGVTGSTRNIFLESAWFHPVDIRKTSFRHGLRTDAALRFEKNVDISQTAAVLKRASLMITEITGATIEHPIVDEYPAVKEKEQVGLKYQYLKKLSGKNYHPDTVKNILTNLGFELIKDGMDELWVAVPFHKPDISLPADLVEEILRIDGLDNIEIPSMISITPMVEENDHSSYLREKLGGYLTGLGFHEILTNPITNSAYYGEEDLQHSVKMLNNLSADLNILRPSMLETGLESIAYNLNRRNYDLRFYEFGKIYQQVDNKYSEPEQLCLYVTGNAGEKSWRNTPNGSDLYTIKGMVAAILKFLGVTNYTLEDFHHSKFSGQKILAGGKEIVRFGPVSGSELKIFDIRQPVMFASFNWEPLVALVAESKLVVRPLPRFPSVERDLAVVISKQVSYGEVEKLVNNLSLSKLQEVKLFDIFESEKLGAGKKSLAIRFTFQDEDRTLTDKEIDGWMMQIRAALEKELSAGIRK